MNKKQEIFFSVDIETAGPIPGKYSLLSIGACNIWNTTQTFSCKLKPTTFNADPKALEITGLSLEQLTVDGLDPEMAMRQFREWITSISGDRGQPIFVGFNAAFDWSFINYYFHNYLGENPFGFSALDIKSLYMGAAGSSWSQTRSSQIAEVLHPLLKGDHDPLHDAQYQAELFRLTRRPSVRHERPIEDLQ